MRPCETTRGRGRQAQAVGLSRAEKALTAGQSKFPW